ncbi:Uma2 family endonuclease [Desulfosporosinus sp. PR]|uniref:Uma2 family endonuclease n=1 Tax=Candidatus Desulfosporosinus nitrosoreducens TaxID=3401928 RepID=UPI0027EB7BE8|nr:Uma2 family endonuclease [Desulfosporosinus sp. PR]MDQ7096667.1 Uma2 family endonuclease [Desulfosporosinus sp. PR]
MPLPESKGKYTYADYLTWPEEGERWEIIDGVPYMQAAPTWQHQAISGNIFGQFFEYLKGKPWQVFAAPFDLIEITSPSTGKMDRLIKYNKYEKAGVKEYWIVEPETKIVSVFVLQDNNRYGRLEVYAEEDKINISIFPDLFIDLKPVFTGI